MVRRGRLAAPLLALLLSLPALAADYRFTVNDMTAELTVRADGLVELRYALTFTPEPGSHPVDIVDIGMPNESYELGSARAAIAGTKLADIRRSSYVKPGVEVHLGAQAIVPGRTGTLEFSILLPRMVYADSEDARFASLQFKTTWFDDRYVAGNAERIEIRFHLPPGSRPEEVKYHDFSNGHEPSEMFLDGDRVVYRWLWLDRPATGPCAAGASFPRSLVAGVSVPPRRSILKAVAAVFFALIAFVLSLAPVWIILLIIILAVRSNRRRLQRYLPPRIGIESGGIKRGLSPAESALLQELPLSKVLLLIAFGLLKKGKLAIKEIAAGDFRYHEQAREGLELHEYEASFLAAINRDNLLDKGKLRTLFTAMIAALEKKMTGFSRRETNAFYQTIMNKAWEQVRNCPPGQLPAELAQSLEWLVLDPEYEKKLEPYADNAVFLPGGTDHWYQHFPQRSTAGGSSVPGSGSARGVGQAAANLVGSLQSFSAALLGDSAAFTSAITRVTNPPPAPSAGGSGHSGGGSCACACACAGCACACAGGGR